MALLENGFILFIVIETTNKMKSVELCPVRISTDLVSEALLQYVAHILKGQNTSQCPQG